MKKRKSIGRRVVLGVGLAVPVLVGAALVPGMASGEDKAPARDHAAHGDARHAATMGAELAQVRRATAEFHRVDQAVAAGYELGWVNGAGMRIVGACVAHPTAGAMGYHYFNAELMADDTTDARRPEALVYEKTPDGELDLVAVEWVVRSARSNPPGVSETPSVLGMEMHVLVPPPGPAFYLMHAWVWKDNPAGMFADWNPDVTCR
jgi:hypothetical protein